MSQNDPLAATLSKMLNAEKVSKKECTVKPISKFIMNVMAILKDNHYIGDYTEVKDSKGSILKIKLIGKINCCGAIKPRFPVTKKTYEKYEKRYLLAKDFGLIIVSTPKGIMTHIESKEKGLGGRLIAYCY